MKDSQPKSVRSAEMRKAGAPKPSRAEKCESFGEDTICERIVDGKSLTAIGAEIGVPIGFFVAWLEATPDRSARVREARARSARLWDDKATQGIEGAKDQFELAKAKEMAHHYRWRASKIAPREYGEKLDLNHTGTVDLSDAALEARIAALASALNIAIDATGSPREPTDAI